MIALGITPVVIGTGRDRETGAVIAEDCAGGVLDLTDHTSLTDLVSLARHAKGAVGNDTGPMHLIAAVGCPSVVLYANASDPALCGQRGKAVTILRRNTLTQVTVDEVYAALSAHLDPGRGMPPPEATDDMPPPRHGGNLVDAERRYGRPALPWLDLSTGINPRPYPVRILPETLWHRLPEEDAETSLTRTAARFYGLAPGAEVVAAPGTQSLIQWLPRLRSPGRVAILGPTYSEHAAAWTLAGHRVQEVATLAEIGNAEVVVVVNPNNPDGRHIPPPPLAEMARILARRGGFLVVDEAFADASPAPDMSLIRGCPGMVVLRSFGKFFGLAGVRLGFAIAQPPLAAALRSALGPWAVSAPAMAIGTMALADEAWATANRRWLAEMANRLEQTLVGVGFEPVGGTELFRLVRAPWAGEVCRSLGHRGILVRSFPQAPDWLRFGVPASEHDLDRLHLALAEAMDALDTHDLLPSNPSHDPWRDSS
ncbi:MAG: threonine-phosphate decarboxylase CobD [Alphaproteobacteria bacterium]